MMRSKHLLAATVAVASFSTAAFAAGGTQTGTFKDGTTWTATKRIIGQTPTGTIVPTPTPGGPSTSTNPGGGDPRYLASNAAGYSGVVGMLMTYNDGSRFVCSGTLTGSYTVVTAGHCVSSGGGVKDADLVRTQVFFQNDASSALDERVYGIPTGNFPAGVTVIDVAKYAVAAGYTGQVVDQNDIAVLTLAEYAPKFAERMAVDFARTDLTGDQFNVAGYGTRSGVGGAYGNNAPTGVTPTGYRRQGDNVYDFRLGDEAFDGFWEQPNPNRPGSTNFFGTAEIEYSYLSDFDNGLAANDTACRIAAAVGVPDDRFCSTGLGDMEVNIAGGDSGGGAFIGGKLVSVNSYGLSFGTGFGDFRTGLNSSWGEFSGYVPTFIHEAFISANSGVVPEPATWAQMILGFGVVGFGLRRRKALVAA